jgi:formate dehydrogenase major subunit
MDDVRKEVMAKWTPDKVEDVPACPRRGAPRRRDAGGTVPRHVVWCMGITQHHVGTANVRASCILQLALGNVGVSGGGANIYRGHDNVQGATDIGPNPDSLPGYYGIAEGSWKHFAKVWGVDYDWIKGRFGSKDDGKAGHHGLALVRRVMEKNENIDQPSNLRAVFWGHAPNSRPAAST